MDKIVIRGGRCLRGTVPISGSKNSALPILAATILCKGRTQLKNVPAIRDIKSMCAALRLLGAKVEVNGSEVMIDTRNCDSFEAPYELVKTMRASVLVLGPLLAANGRARVSLPGGCAIGARPIDIHLKGFEKLGAEITLEGGYVVARAKRLKGGDIHLNFPSVGATENLMMAAALAKGTTTITNAAREPEIEDLADFINAMGGRVHGAGTQTIVIEGVESLHGATHAIIPDRIEAGTFLIAGIITGGEVSVNPCPARYLGAFLDKLREAGAAVAVEGETITVGHSGHLKPVRVETEVFPGFPTDLQAQLMALTTIIPGASVFTETVFENRYMHVPELSRMGARITVDGRIAVVEGVAKLEGARIMASDLRASAALVLAGLAACGETHVSRVYHIDRGYESIEKKLAALGAEIHRRRDEVN